MSIFEKESWSDRITEYPKRRRLTEVEGQPNIFDVDREEGTITSEGTAFNSVNMNGLEDRIESAFDSIETNINTSRTGVMLYNGQTTGTVTLSDSVENYDYIEIHWENNDGVFNCTKVLNPNGKMILLSTTRKRNSDNKLWFKTSQYTISDRTIYPDTGYYGNIALTIKISGGIASIQYVDCDSNQYMEICKVIGYKNNI